MAFYRAGHELNLLAVERQPCKQESIAATKAANMKLTEALSFLDSNIHALGWYLLSDKTIKLSIGLLLGILYWRNFVINS